MTPERPTTAVEIRHLRLVAAIAEHGSMTAAARVLHLTQPALSHQLRELERRLRTPLFVRTTRRMVLTPAGEQLAQTAQTVLEHIGTFERQVRDGNFATARGVVRLATECYTAYHWLPAVLRDFKDRWPKVDLQIAAAHTSAPLAALREGSLDLALVYNPVEDRRLRFEPLFHDELVLVVAPGHPMAGREFVLAESLRHEHLFLYTSADQSSTVERDILRPAAVQPAQVTRLQLTEAILELVAANFGVAVMARWAVAPTVRSGAVRAVRLGRKGHQRTWYTAVRSGDVTPAYRLDLAELLRRHVGGGPAVRDVPRLRVS